MDQFVVPQFIDVENKIIGPISVRQFLILLGTGLAIFLCYELFSFWLFAISGVFLIAIGGTFAFVKINGQMFHIFVLLLIQTLRRPNLKVWQHQEYEKPRALKKKKAKEEVTAPKEEVGSSRLTELSLMVDTGGAYQLEEQQEKAKEKKASEKKLKIKN